MSVLALGACGSSSPESQETAQPTATSQSPSLAEMWTQVGNVQEPLFSLVVVHARGFTRAELKYLRDVQSAWAVGHSQASRLANVQTAAASTSQAKGLIAKITRQTSPLLARRSPSARFQTLHRDARMLIKRLREMAALQTEYQDAAANEQTALVTRVAPKVAQMQAIADAVADEADALYLRYGHGPYEAAAASVPTSDAATPSPEVSPSDTTPPSEPGPSPTAAPDPKSTSAERQQIGALVRLDTWLGAILQDSSPTISDALPWDDATESSFTLNMGFVVDACDQWIVKKPAGTHVSGAFAQYISGLKLVRQAAVELTGAAQNSDAKALAAGKATLDKATPKLREGIARLKALL